jgi:hypothetical protein
MAPRPQSDRNRAGEAALAAVVAMPGLEVPGLLGHGHVANRGRPRHARETQIELRVAAKPVSALVGNAHLTRLVETTDRRAAAQAEVACQSARIRPDSPGFATKPGPARVSQTTVLPQDSPGLEPIAMLGVSRDSEPSHGHGVTRPARNAKP